MRKLRKELCPAVLSNNGEDWLADYLADKDNQHKKTKYRHEDIKAALKKETGWKCAYCESKIGHCTPGDVEHKVPSSVDDSKHFDWQNLTVACTECNRRKCDTYDSKIGFIDPYSDNVETLVLHEGPIAFWQPGSALAETAIRVLALNAIEDRIGLVIRKTERLNSFANLVERYKTATDKTLKALLKKEIDSWKSRGSEYSAMIKSYAAKAGV